MHRPANPLLYSFRMTTETRLSDRLSLSHNRVMNVAALANRSIPIVDSKMPLGLAAALVQGQGYDYGYVVANGHPVGILELRIAFLRCMLRGGDVETIRAIEVMEPDVQWFFGDWDCADVAAVMAENGLDHCLVRDRQGELLGFVTRDDFRREFNKWMF